MLAASPLSIIGLEDQEPPNGALLRAFDLHSYHRRARSCWGRAGAANVVLLPFLWCRVTLSDKDRQLLDRCLKRKPRAWQEFVDRFLGLVVHVVRHTATARHIQIDDATREDLVAEVFFELVRDDFRILRRFRHESSLATYLTVISRRVVVRRLIRSGTRSGPMPVLSAKVADAAAEKARSDGAEERIADRDQVEQLMTRLDPQEADVVRLYHLEGRTYREISAHTGMPENSVGPLLSRARLKMRGA